MKIGGLTSRHQPYALGVRRLAVAAPPKRVPGYAVVIVLVLVAILVGVFVVYWRPTVARGPPVLVIRAEDTIGASPANTQVPATFGPHCAKSFWNAAERILSVEADVDLAGGSGILHQHYTRTTENLAGDGGDYTNTTVYLDPPGWRIASPVDNRTLETFAISGANVTANGTTYGPGESWTMHFEYDVTTPGGIAQVVEDIVFQNEGILRPHIVPVAACA